MARGQAQIIIRVTEELKKAIHAAAMKNKRSVNGEIVYILEKIYTNQEDKSNQAKQ